MRKRAVQGDCSICCEKMGCDDNEDEDEDDDENNYEDDDEDEEDEEDDDDDDEYDEEEGELVWCKDGCGQSVHKDCFETWKKECEDRGRAATCVNCRTQ